MSYSLDVYHNDGFGQYLPPGIRSGHDLLYGRQATSDFVPAPESLAQFLRDYSGYLARQSEGPIYEVLTFDLMDLSELLIAYLVRASAAGVPLPADGTVERCRDLLTRLTLPLADLVAQWRGSGNDVLKRLQTIAQLLGASPHP